MREFTVEISYSQIAVFDSGLEDPFNDWTDQHVRQGFSWRPGSVSFQTPMDSGKMTVQVRRVTEKVELTGERVIKVPFSWVGKNEVCIASIADFRPLQLSAQKYQLCYESGVKAAGMWCRLTFIEDESPESKVVSLGRGISVPSELLMLANPA